MIYRVKNQPAATPPTDKAATDQPSTFQPHRYTGSCIAFLSSSPRMAKG